MQNEMGEPIYSNQRNRLDVHKASLKCCIHIMVGISYSRT